MEAPGGGYPPNGKFPCLGFLTPSLNECEQICLHKNFQQKLGDSSSSSSPFYCVVEETNDNKWENPEETELELQLRSHLDSNKSGPAVNDPELDLALGHPIPTNGFF